MAQQHTAGPWKSEYRFRSARDKKIKITDGGGFLLALVPRDVKQAQQEANAAIMAAAPQMCQALEELIEEMENDPRLNHHAAETTGFDMARAALQKAKGA